MEDAMEDTFLDKLWQHTAWSQLRILAQQLTASQQDAVRVRLRATLLDLEKAWQSRLQMRAPYQYLSRGAHWRDVVVAVGPGVLIPRPETEELVDFVANALSTYPELASAPWADLGCGSGALTVGVARALSRYPCTHDSPQMYAVDVSAYGVAYTRFNASRLCPGMRVDVRQGSWGEPLEGLEGQLGGLVSNPPYIPAREMATLQAEVALHEPALALHGGNGAGIDSLLHVLACARRLLRPGGFVALETAGGDQAQHVAELLRAGTGVDGGFSAVEVRADCYGKYRFVTGFKSGLPRDH